MRNFEMEIALEKELEANGLWSSSVRIVDGDVVVYNVEGDWKHDHIRTNIVVMNWFRNRNFIIGCESEIVTDDGDSDYYTADHHYHIIAR